MTQKIKLRGVGNMTVLGDIPTTGKEYMMAIVVERSGKRIDERDPEDPVEIFEMHYLRTEEMMEIGSKKKIVIQNGKTKSQILRWRINEYLKRKGQEPTEENYEKVMDSLIDKIDSFNND